MEFLTFAAAIWAGAGIICAPFAYGLSFAYFQRKWPTLAADDYGRDRAGAAGFAVLALVAPPSIITHLVGDGTAYGLKFR